MSEQEIKACEQLDTGNSGQLHAGISILHTAVRVPAQPDHGVKRMHRRVLIISDDPQLAGLSRRRRASNASRFSTLSDVADARELRRRALSDRPDVIVIDCETRGVDASWLRDVLRKDARLGTIPILGLLRASQLPRECLVEAGTAPAEP